MGVKIHVTSQGKREKFRKESLDSTNDISAGRRKLHNKNLHQILGGI
jgi:hypothetical protein